MESTNEPPRTRTHADGNARCFTLVLEGARAPGLLVMAGACDSGMDQHDLVALFAEQREGAPDVETLEDLADLTIFLTDVYKGEHHRLCPSGDARDAILRDLYGKMDERYPGEVTCPRCGGQGYRESRNPVERRRGHADTCFLCHNTGLVEPSAAYQPSPTRFAPPKPDPKPAPPPPQEEKREHPWPGEPASETGEASNELPF